MKCACRSGILVLILACACADNESSGTALLRWLTASNGTAHVAVGTVPGQEKLRGVLAGRNFKAGEAVISVPLKLAVRIGLASQTAQELALRLLRKRAAQPEWWAAHAPHWQSLPPAGRVYAKESWRQEHLAPLQDPELERYISANALMTTAAYHGVLDATSGLRPVATANVTLAEFRHWAALISSYSFVFPAADGTASRYLLPLLDLINHDGASPAVRVEQDAAAGVFGATALRDIRAGQEVTHRYSFALERPDYALANYFIVQRPEQPLRAALDLPTHDLEMTFENASDAHFEPEAGVKAQLEARRLANLLAAFPTSQAQDEDLLARGVGDAGAPLDWRVRRIIEFRVQRKRALRAAIQRLHKARAPGPPVHPGRMRRRQGSQDGGDAAADAGPTAGWPAEAAAEGAMGHDREGRMGSPDVST